MAYTPLHAAVGIAIVKAIPNPFISLPAAFLSHFIIDFIPEAEINEKSISGRMLSIVELFIGGMVIANLIVDRNIWMLFGALIANIPDMIDAVNVICRRKRLWCCHPGGWFPIITDAWKMTPMNPVATIFIDIFLVWILLILR